MDQVEEESHADEIENEASQISETQNLDEQTQDEEIAGDKTIQNSCVWKRKASKNLRLW